MLTSPPTRLCPGMKKWAAVLKVINPIAVPINAADKAKKNTKRRRKKKGFVMVLRSPTIVSTIPPSTENPFLMVPPAENEEDLKLFFLT